ncbi:MAG: LysR family transcriptional regulator [Pseudomonadota bacterium]
MNLKQLIAFREVMVTGSVSEAARNLFRTQPAISATISGLETELRCKLFERRSGRLHPVPEAHFLFEESIEILRKLETLELNMKNLVNLETGVLRIVAMPGPSVFFMPDLISRFVQGRCGIKVDLVTRSSAQVYPLLATQRYDIGLADRQTEEVDESGLISLETLEFDSICALHPDDPLTARETITPEDLDNKPMAVLHPDHATHASARRAFDNAGARFNPVFETQYFFPLLTYVENRQAYSIIDPISARSYGTIRGEDAQLVFRRFVPSLTFAVSVVIPAHRPLSVLAKAFYELLFAELSVIGELKTAN